MYITIIIIIIISPEVILCGWLGSKHQLTIIIINFISVKLLLKLNEHLQS